MKNWILLERHRQNINSLVISNKIFFFSRPLFGVIFYRGFKFCVTVLRLNYFLKQERMYHLISWMWTLQFFKSKNSINYSLLGRIINVHITRSTSDLDVTETSLWRLEYFGLSFDLGLRLYGLELNKTYLMHRGKLSELKY